MNGGFDGVRRMASRWKWLACVWLVAWFVLHAGAGVASVLPDELKEAISQAGIPREAVGIVVEGQLHDTGTVAQIDEYKSAKVALALYPAHQADTLADILCGQLGYIAGSFIVFCKLSTHFYPLS